MVRPLFRSVRHGCTRRSALFFGLVFIASSCALPWMVSAESNPQETKVVEPRSGDGADETGEFGAHGFNIVRVEQEDKITVPADKADEVWEFLSNYLQNGSESLKKLDPNFTSYWAEELFIDTYFDTPALQILGKAGGVRHRRRQNLTNPDDAKNGRELMQIKLNDLSDNPLERGEIKYEIQYPQEISQADDAHPVLGIIKPDSRDDLNKRLTSIGIDPYAMRPILTVSDIRRRVYVRKNNEPFLSVSFDNATAGNLWAKWHFFEIEPELNEIPFTEGNEATRKYMEKINNEIIGTLMAKFPYLKRDLTPKYCKAFYSLESQIPAYRFLVRMRLDNADGMFLSGTVGVAILAGVFFGVRRLTRKSLNESAERVVV